MEAVKIGLIERDEELREVYKDIFLRSKNFEYVLGVDSVEKFLRFYNSYMEFDLILLDISEKSDVMDIGKIIKNMPYVKIIVSSSITDINTILKSLRLGAVGFLFKNISKEALENHLLTFKKEGVAFSPLITKKIVSYFSPSNQFAQLPLEKRELTNKEKQVVNLLIDGLSYGEISATLNLSINGVRYHIKNIYTKLQINSRSEIYKKYFGNNSN